jgi:ATP phosphoribosyltransferase
VDLTSTGSTLRVNGLREIATVLDSSARLITARQTAASGHPGDTRAAGASQAEELVSALRSVLAARGRRYVMANVPRTSLDAVRKVLPGISGPTVIDLLDGGDMVAVHAVAPAATLHRTLRDLKQLGGEGILVTRIERLMA